MTRPFTDDVLKAQNLRHARRVDETQHRSIGSELCGPVVNVRGSGIPPAMACSKPLAEDSIVISFAVPRKSVTERSSDELRSSFERVASKRRCVRAVPQDGARHRLRHTARPDRRRRARSLASRPFRSAAFA